MKDTSTVSILVPVCNVERYLRECLDSLISQTLEDIQIICIDDGSTDSSLVILQEYQKKDDRVEIISKPNSGYGDSMNLGLKRATGTYIGIVESDDFAEKDMFEKLVALAECHDVDLVKSNFYAHETLRDRKEDQLVDNLEHCPKDHVICPLQDHNVFLTRPAIWSALYRRDFLLANDIWFLPTSGASFQDTSFNFKAMAAAQRVYLTGDAYLHYRVDNSNSSVKSQAKIFPICEEYDEIWRFARQRPEAFEVLRFLIPKIQYGGYRWNLERLIESLRYGFYERFIEDYKKIESEGSISPDWLDENVYHELAEMLADPDGYYERTFGPITVNETVVLRFSSPNASEIARAVESLLGQLGAQDELLIHISGAAEKQRILKELTSRDPRIFAADNLFSTELLEIVDPIRLSGKILTVFDIDTSPKARKGRSRNELGIKSSYKKRSYDVPRLLELQVPISYSLLFSPLYADALISSVTTGDPNSISFCSTLGEYTVAEYRTAQEAFFQIGSTVQTVFSDPAIDYCVRKEIFLALRPLWATLKQVHEKFDYDERLQAGERPSPRNLPILECGTGSSDASALRPDVSVIIPVYNVRGYLDACLDTVLAQDANIEVICVDDGSSDGSLEALEARCADESRLSVIAQLNGGAGSARNRGIDHARGSHLAFIDPDDLYPDNHTLSRLLKAAEENGALVCGGSLALLNPDGSLQMDFDIGQAYCKFKKAGFISFGEYDNDYGWIRFLYDARIFNDGNARFPEFYWYEDPVFFMQIGEAVGRLYCIPDVVYVYRVDYKESDWAPLQARDLLKGAAMNLAAAAAKDQDDLYSKIILRLDYDYCRRIALNINDDEVLMRLVGIQSSLEPERLYFVREQGHVSHILRALKEGRGADAKLLERMSHKIVESRGYKVLQDIRRKL